MKYRKLRIGWSVGWGILCVLMIGLWVRSYWRLDRISGSRGSEYIYFDMMMGRLHYSRSALEGLAGPSSVPWQASHDRIFDSDLAPHMSEAVGSHHVLGFGWKVWANGWEVSITLWLLVLISGILAASPWMHWKNRFSLRTLLITTTLFALALGIFVWLKKPAPMDEDLYLSHGDRLSENELLRGTSVICIPWESHSNEKVNDDSDMVQFAKMRNLKSLSLVGSSVTSAGFTALKPLHLEELVARFTKIDDDAIRCLANSTGLKVLVIADTQITNKSIAFIANHFPELEDLNVSQTAVNDEAIPLLAGLKHLTNLNLSDTKITDASVPALSRMTQLKQLDVGHISLDPPYITEEGKARLRRALPHTEMFP